MSDPSTDLSAITSSPTEASPPAGRLRAAAWLLPAAILLGFTLLFLLLFRDRLTPAREVNVAPVLAIGESAAEQDARPASGRLLFQASGWIEPDPFSLKVTALQDGVIDQVHVLEGQLVSEGDLLATLVGTDTLLAKSAAASELDMIRAEFEAHCTETQVLLHQMEAEKAGLLTDRAHLEEALDRLTRIQSTSPGNYGESERVSARLDHARREAAVSARQARIGEISHKLNRIAYETVAMEAKIRTAATALEKAALAHDRTRVHAPAAGRIMRLPAVPGQKKMLGMDEEDSATIAILYDPGKLQIRVDVPLADAAGLHVGQRAKIHCNLLPDLVFEGEVTRIAGEADLQRNTLQAKVRILDPHAAFRPEMLCRVEFLETAGEPASSSHLSTYIPRAALREDGTVWVFDPETRRTAPRTVTPGTGVRDDHIHIRSGLRPGEQVILDPSGLRPNQRVTPARP